MIKTQTQIADPRLPREVICLHDAVEQIDNDTVSETLELSLDNGYVLAGIEDDEMFETEYTLLKLEVEDEEL